MWPFPRRADPAIAPARSHLYIDDGVTRYARFPLRRADDMTQLKLPALAAADLQVLSAHVPEAVLRVADMGYARGGRRFARRRNRFDWETGASRRGKGVRKRAALHFDAGQSVATNGFAPAAPEGVLELLDIAFMPVDGPAGIIE